jgi:hypothetical protein
MTNWHANSKNAGLMDSRWDFLILMNGNNLQSLEITPSQFADGGSTLGSGSEVDCFRVFSRQRLFTKATAAKLP